MLKRFLTNNYKLKKNHIYQYDDIINILNKVKIVLTIKIICK